MNDLINELLKSVRVQVRDPSILEELDKKIAQKRYRQVFLMLHNLQNTGEWVLDSKDEKNLEEFWWKYAN